MTEGNETELTHGSGNIFRDFGEPNADVEQLKCLLAARIIGVLDDHGWSTREAGRRSGIDYSEFARNRKPDLKRFTADRLIGILNKLDQIVDI